MNILINCSNLRVGGGLQVAHSFLNEIKNNENHQFVVILSSAMDEIIDSTAFSKNFTFYKYTITPSVFKSLTGNDKFLTDVERKHQIDRVFTVFGPSYWRPKAKHICGFAKSQYIFKDSPFFEIISNVQKSKLRIKESIQMFSFEKQCDCFITENESVSDRLRSKVKGKPVFTVTNTYNQIFNNPDLWDKSIVLPHFNGTTLLTISANYPHKNLQIIPSIIDYLIEKYPDFKFRFIVTLHKCDIPKITERHYPYVLFVGKVNINQCPWLYKQSSFMFLPTLLECFSASYPEAMVMQVPIITTNLPFARGICGEAAIYFDPLSASDAGDKIYSSSMNFDLINSLVQKGRNQLNSFDNAKLRAQKYLNLITN